MKLPMQILRALARMRIVSDFSSKNSKFSLRAEGCLSNQRLVALLSCLEAAIFVDENALYEKPKVPAEEECNDRIC
jgi:hypothetical protein